MVSLLAIDGKRPVLAEGVFVAPNAVLIGDVELADEASVWFGAVLRGDVGAIRIGPRSNLQDLVCVHMTQSLSATEVGADCTIGHGAILHGCRVDDGCLIGMGAIVLDGAIIGERSVVAAGAVVTARTVVPPRSFVAGMPARIVRPVTDEQAEVFVKVAWFRPEENEVRVTTIVQKWKDDRGSWLLVGEERLDGDVGLLGEERPIAPAAVRRNAQFPTIRIGDRIGER